MFGYIYTVVCAVTGSNILPAMNPESHIPAIIMETFQCLVWGTGALVGIFTLYGMWKKSREK